MRAFLPQEATGLCRPHRGGNGQQAKPHRPRSHKPRLGLPRGGIGARSPVPDYFMWVVHAFRANAIPYLEG